MVRIGDGDADDYPEDMPQGERVVAVDGPGAAPWPGETADAAIASVAAPASEDAPFPFRIAVLDGAHAGAAIEVDAGPLRIGGGLDNDLVLLDLDDAAFALEIDAEGVHGAASEGPPRPIPCELSLGPVRLRVTRTGDAVIAPVAPTPDGRTSTAPPAAARRGGALRPAMAGVALAGLLAVVATPLATGLLSTPKAPRSDIQASLPTADSAPPAPTATLPPAPGPAPAPAPVAVSASAPPSVTLTAIEARVAAAGLADKVSLALAEDGALLATGSVSASDAALWRDLARWADGRLGAAGALQDQVQTVRTVDTAPPRIGLQAVWVGEDPYLIAANGRRSRPGDLLPGGWRIVSITPEAVALARADATDAPPHRIQLAGARAPGDTP